MRRRVRGRVCVGVCHLATVTAAAPAFGAVATRDVIAGKWRWRGCGCVVGGVLAVAAAAAAALAAAASVATIGLCRYGRLLCGAV